MAHYQFTDGLPPEQVGTSSPNTEWTWSTLYTYHQVDPSTGLFGILPGLYNDLFRWYHGSSFSVEMGQDPLACQSSDGSDEYDGCRFYNEMFYGNSTDEALINQFYCIDWHSVARTLRYAPIYFGFSTVVEDRREYYPQLMRLVQWTDATECESIASDNGSPYVALDFDDIIERFADDNGITISNPHGNVLGKWCVSTNEFGEMPLYLGSGDPETDHIEELFDTLLTLLTVFYATQQIARWAYGYSSYADEIGIDMLANEPYDVDSYADFHESTDYEYAAMNYEDCEEYDLWNDYVIFHTTDEHGFTPGEEVDFLSVIEGVEGSYIIAFIVDEWSFGILASDLPEEILNGSDPAGILDGREYCVVSETSADPLEVYENDTLLTIGIDYLITLDDGATWFSDWPTDSSFNEFYRRAKAGRFYIKFLELNRSSVYWCRYFIYRNQELSSEGLVRLRNGRVIFDESLKDTAGSLQTILISRTNTANPYITPITTEYSLRVQERSEQIDPDGRRRRGNVSSSESGDSLNVS